MTPKSFVYLAVAAALSVLFAIVSYASNNQWGSGKAAGDKLFPSLATDASQIAAIEIRQDDNTVVLERMGGSWGVKNRDGYPVDAPKVRTLLVGLAEAELIETKTRRPDRYAALELEDPVEKSAKSRLVRLTGAKGSVIAEVVLGKKRQEVFGTGKAGTYVRKPGDAQTWLTNAELDASVTLKDWVKTSVLAMDTAKINRLSIEIPGEEALRIERAAGGGKDAKDGKEAADSQTAGLQLVGFPPPGKKLKDAAAAESIARAVSSIDMEDVHKLDAASSGAGISTVKIESADGTTTALRLRKEGDAHWLSIVATGEGEAKQAADEIGKRTQGWEFKIPAHKADSILKKRPDLLEAPAS